MDVKQSASQSAAVSLWDVRKSSVTVSTSLLQLKMCELVVRSLFYFKSVFALKVFDSVLLATGRSPCRH